VAADVGSGRISKPQPLQLGHIALHWTQTLSPAVLYANAAE